MQEHLIRMKGASWTRDYWYRDSRRSGCNEHGDDENGSDTLHSSDRNQGQEHHEEVVIDLDPDAHGLS